MHHLVDYCVNSTGGLRAAPLESHWNAFDWTSCHRSNWVVACLKGGHHLQRISTLIWPWTVFSLHCNIQSLSVILIRFQRWSRSSENFTTVYFDHSVSIITDNSYNLVYYYTISILLSVCNLYKHNFIAMYAAAYEVVIPP